MHDAIAITSVLEADAVRYERREAEKRSQISRPQEGRQGPGGREEDGPFWSAEWKWRREYRAADAAGAADAALRIDS